MIVPRTRSLAAIGNSRETRSRRYFMKIQELHVGMKVKHPQHGMGTVKSITENMAEIRFNDTTRTIAPETSDLTAAEARTSISGLDMPLEQFVEKVTRVLLDGLGLEKPGDV